MREPDLRDEIWRGIGLVSSNFSRLELRLGTLFARLINGDDTLALRLFFNAPSVPARLGLLEIAFGLGGGDGQPAPGHEDRKKLFAAIRSAASKRNKAAHAIASVVQDMFEGDGPRVVAMVNKDPRSLEELSSADLLAFAVEIEGVEEQVTDFIKRIAADTCHPSAERDG